MLRRLPRRLAGVTLAETLAVVAILSLAAAIAIPQASSVTPQVADAAAAEVAHAIRFAQREAMRTGVYHVAEINPATQSIRVFRLASPASSEDPDPVMHPVYKQPYRISLASNGARAIVTGAVFTYGAEKTGSVAFGADGAPLKFLNGQSPSVALSSDGVVGLQAGNILRTVTVERITGRVSL